MATDWERLANMSDEEAYRGALADPDNPPLASGAGFVRARDIPGQTLVEKYENLKKRKYKKLVSIRYDADVLAYFRAKGRGYQTAMNNALRAFMEAELAQPRARSK